MVAQPQSQSQSQPQIQTPSLSSHDEALKRNTDCVYFLASPLTCKKGNECEYRHSEYARVNPRDCWYWLNGNCLNPKCSFRHPPLDGLLGTPSATAAGPSVPPLQHPTPSATHAPYNSSKPVAPCIFFQKGFCLKGDRCAFLHGPIPNTGNKAVTQAPMNSQGTEPQSFKKQFGGIEKNTQDRKISQGNVAKPVGGFEAKPAQKVETAPQKKFFELKKHVPPASTGFDDEASEFKIISTPQLTNEPTVVMSSRLHQAYVPDDHSFHNGKDSDEFLRESSPGFDVLVADELRNSDYYHGEDEFGNTGGQDERNLDSLSEYDLGHSTDYNLAADIGRDRFRVPQGYDSYDHTQETYMWEQHRKPPAHLERTHRRSDSPNNAEVSDLRLHLSKRRKGNGLKSVVAHDCARESHGEEHSHRHFPRKDLLQLPSNESSISNRFRGRIKLPANGGNGHSERESDRGRVGSRLSSGRLPSQHQGMLQDRIRGRVQDGERRNFRDRPVGRELMGDRTNGFYVPKRLSEHKNGRSSENRDQQFLGKRKGLRDHQQSDDGFQFEGPKPLSEILKEKKRGVGAGAASQSDNSSENKNTEMTDNSDHKSLTKTQNGSLSETMENVKNHEVGSKSQVTDVVGQNAANTDTTHGQSSEKGLIYDEAMEDQEYEGDDQRDDGEYDYDQVDEGDYEYEQVEEGENPDQEEYIDDEDGDDFAKKIGVILT